MEKKEKNNFLNFMVDKSQYNAIFFLFCFVFAIFFNILYQHSFKKTSNTY